jgi:hypothetical protein
VIAVIGVRGAAEDRDDGEDAFVGIAASAEDVASSGALETR